MEKINIPAKLNLSLAITGKQNNLHTLDMEVVSVDLFDELEYQKNDKNKVDITVNCNLDGFEKSLFMPLIDKVVSAFESKYGAVGADIIVNKNIPICAGMGGSSACIVGVAKALAKLKNVQLDDEFLLSLGSDVPYMYVGGHCRVSGVGDKIEKLQPIKMYFVVLLSSKGVDSKTAYALYDKIGAYDNMSCRNDLEKSAEIINQDISVNKKTLLDCGATKVMLTGSGSAVIGIFDNIEQAQLVYSNLPNDCKKFLLSTFN